MIDPNLINSLKQVNLPDLKRENLGPFNFSQDYNYLEQSTLFLREIIENKNINLITPQHKNIESNLRIFLELVSTIENFNPKEVPNASEQYNEIKHNIHRTWENIFNNIYPLLTFLRTEKENINKHREDLQNLNRNFKKILDQAEDKFDKFDKLSEKYNQENKNKSLELENIIKDTKDKLTRIEDSAKNFSADKVITNYAKIFDNEYKRYNEIVKYWWIILILLIIAEFVIAYLLLFEAFPYFKEISGGELSTSEIISFIFFKLFILSLGGVVIGQIIKNLNANNHLRALNKSKANALSSFEVFIHASNKDSEVKSALLIEISKAIYGPSVSGFLSKDDSNSNSSSIEIIKKIMDGKGIE